VTAAAVVTVDVDGPWGLACRSAGGGWSERLTSRSEAWFGLGRGLDRVLDVLAARDVRATFFVVGRVALAVPERVREIAAAGHEVAHHGFAHLPTCGLGAAGEREEIERGLDALGDCLGAAPGGYRSPAWELTPATLALLGEHGFAYDSSLMGDDRPHGLRAGAREIVEIPVHWTLDDVPYLAFHPEAPARLGAGAALAQIWLAAHADAVAERRPVVYTVHPEHTGRSPHQHGLAALLDAVVAAGTPTRTAAEIAAAYAARRPAAPRTTAAPTSAAPDAPAIPAT
jgi:peptidoglycan/xylan/chitin deacetylase (PgdA/CDA1 family)